MAIAKSKIPKILRMASVAAFGSFLSIKGMHLRMMKITSRLIRIPMMMAYTSNEERSESIVVNVPAPASKGKAIGTMLPDAPSLLSLRKK